MRPLEVLVVTLVLATLFASLPFKKPYPRLLLGFWTGALLSVAAQALVEKSRWQLAPAYLVLGLVSIAVYSTWKRRLEEPSSVKRRRWPRIVGFIFGLLALGVSSLLATQLPVFSFPPPTGKQAVGVTSYEWMDADRTDEHPTKPSGHRRLVVKVWYPAVGSKASKESYLDQLHAEGFARALQMPGFMLSHLSLVSVNSQRDAAIVPGSERFPVVLWSHGYPLTAESGTFAAEELASHGYVVFAINHTYDTAFVQFQDGTQTSVESSGDLKRIDAVEKILGPRAAVWVADARFVLNEITKLDTLDPRFKGRLDLEHVGYFGHSFGGASAYATMAVDPRVKAAINMDGGLFGVAQHARPTQPFMLMNGDKIEVNDAQLAQTGAMRKEVDAFLEQVEANWSASVAATNAPRYRTRIGGASHLAFSDVGLMVPAVAAGKTPITRAHQLINQYTLAFFDQYLKGQTSPLLSGPAPDAAVTFVAVPATGKGN